MLERIEIPGEHAAVERAWAVVERAFAERTPAAPRRPRVLRPALALAVTAAVLLAAVSPPGRALGTSLRELVGVERAQPALFRLPTPGRLLVASDAGVWVTQADGSKRLLGRYREGSWSPFGKYVVAARRNELAALEPGGDVRWTLARPDVRSARWTGPATDTRIAYVDRSGIRIVAGDGRGDRLLAPAEAGPVAWRPGPRRELAYASAGEVRVQDPDTGRVVWRANRGPVQKVSTLSWSSDGSRLLVLGPRALRVYDARGRIVSRDDPSDGTSETTAAFLPGTHEVVVIRVHGAQSDVFLLHSGRLLFRGTGALEDLALSPDGRWLVVSWPTADQWLFVRVSGGQRLRAVANISAQFRSRSFPRIEGWVR